MLAPKQRSPAFWEESCFCEGPKGARASPEAAGLDRQPKNCCPWGHKEPWHLTRRMCGCYRNDEKRHSIHFRIGCQVQSPIPKHQIHISADGTERTLITGLAWDLLWKEAE
jgi:hypothetical protein